MSGIVVKFIGDHGSSRKICNEIRNRSFKKSNWGWLGAGIYFFEEDKDLARSWAKFKYKNISIDVLECTISVEQENILDVSNPKSDSTKKVNQFREVFLKSGANRNRIIKMEDEEFDGKILEIICDNDGYELVRNFTHTNTDQDRINNKKKSNIPNGVELCVKNVDCITINT